MAQLIALSTLEVNDVTRVEDILLNVKLIKEDTIEAVGDTAQFYSGYMKYLVSATATTIQTAVENYDADVVIPLQVVSINGDLIGSEVRVHVNKIEIGYEDGVNTKLVIRNYGFLQTWVVSDTLSEVVALANKSTFGDGDANVQNINVAVDATIAGDQSVGGNQTVTGNSEVEGALTVHESVVADSVTTIEDVVVGGDLAVAETASFAGAVTMDTTLDVTGKATLGSVETTDIDAPTRDTLAIGTVATSITTGVVGFLSGTHYRTTYVRPGEETLTESAESQELSQVFMTYLTIGDVASSGVMPDGTVRGQLKKIWLTEKTGAVDWTVVYSTVYNVTFTTQGEYIILMWNGTIWEVLDLGLCDGAPVVGVV